MIRKSAAQRWRFPGTEPAGFTLIEIVVVLVILGVVAAVSVPALRDMNQPGPLRDGTASVVRLFERTRATARLGGHDVTLTIDPHSGRFWVDVPSISGAVELPNGVTLLSDRARPRITFASSGNASADMLAVQWSGSTRLITVDAFTGEIREHAR